MKKAKAKKGPRKSRAVPGAKMGRPPKPLDTEHMIKLASIGCTNNEIAAWFDMTVNGFQKRLARDPELLQQLEKGRAGGRMSLRRMQWQKAEGGNVVMLIWLGKQLLSQRDKPADDLVVKVSSEAYRLHIVPPEDQPSETEEPAPSLN